MAYIVDKGYRNYHTEIPNIIFHLGLTSYEISLYAVLKRTAGEGSGGRSTKGRITLAKESGMSPAMVTKTKRKLSEKYALLGDVPLIQIKKRKTESGDDDTDLIEIVDIWDINRALFKKDEKSAEKEIETGGHSVTTGGHSVTTGGHSVTTGGHSVTQRITIEEELYKNNPPIVPPLGDGKKSFSDDVTNLTELLYTSIISWKGAISSNQDPGDWSSDIDKLLRVDGVEPKRVVAIIEWLCLGENKSAIFWRSNILSGAKLRKQFDTLEAKMLSSEEKPQQKEKSNVPHWETFKHDIKKKFQHGKVYNGATCWRDDKGIGFQRGMTHRQVYWDAYGFEEQFRNILRVFGICLVDGTIQKEKYISGMMSDTVNAMRPGYAR